MSAAIAGSLSEQERELECKAIGVFVLTQQLPLYKLLV